MILHCAALANLDQAEPNPELAQRINAEVPGELAASRRPGWSSDGPHFHRCGFRRDRAGNYSETDEPHPINVYARTKLAGEQAVLAANPDAIVARVNFYGWSSGRTAQPGRDYSSTTFLLASGCSGFTDVFFCPLQVNVLGEILLKMAAAQAERDLSCGQPRSLSKYDFGCRIARQFGLDEGLIQPVSWEEAGLEGRPFAQPDPAHR